MIVVFALGIALLVRTYELIETLLPQRLRLRDGNDIVIHLLCAGAAYGLYRHHDLTIYEAAATAFLADAVVSLREFLVILMDFVRVGVLTKNQRHRR